MRKYFNRFKRIIVILLSVISICCFACSCEWGWDWRGPYHHAAIVSTPRKTVCVGEEVYSLIDEKLYRHNNGLLERIELDYYPQGNMRVNDLASDNENLYLACHTQIFSFGKNNFNLLHSDSTIYSLAVDNRKIYYVCFKEWIEDKCKYELCSYDLKVQTKEKLCEFFSVEKYWQVNSQTIMIGERLLFMDERMNLFWVDSLAEDNRVSTCYTKFVNNPMNMFEEISFVLGENIAYLKTIEQGIRFQYLEGVYEYPTQANNLRLYPIVKVIDNKVYFAVNDWVQKEDCERIDCICRYNASMLIVFDLENKQFSLQKQIGEGGVFVDFSKDECIYYSKDAVFKDDSVLKVVGEIKPDVFYKIVEGNPLPLYELKIAYDFGTLNYVLQKNRDYLSNEYA